MEGSIQVIALKLMGIVFGLFQAISDQDALAFLMDLHHVLLCLAQRPTKDLLEDVGHIIHEVNRIVPANNPIQRFKLGRGDRIDQRFGLRLRAPWHMRFLHKPWSQINVHLIAELGRKLHEGDLALLSLAYTLSKQ